MVRRIVLASTVVFAMAAGAASSEELRIGLANSLSGAYATSGQRVLAAAQLAVQTLNATGGVLGRPVRLVPADDACGVEEAMQAAQALVKAGVVFVVGHRCSHSSVMAAPVYEAAGIPMMTTDSTHPRLTEEGRGNVFRLIGRDDEQARLAGDWLAERRPRIPIGVVHDDSLYGRGLALRVLARLHERGVREVFLDSYAAGSTDQDELVARALGAGVKLLYVGGYGPDAGQIVMGARRLGSDLELVGGDGLGMPEFWREAGPAGEGARFTARFDPRAEPGAAAPLEALRSIGLGSQPTGIEIYAAVMLWADAAVRAGSADPGRVIEALHRAGFATPLGRVAFDANGDLIGAGWQWQVWHEGSYGPAETGAASN